MEMKMTAILLASGQARRFGANKLTYALRGQPLYQYSFDLVDAFDWQQVVLVSCYQEILAQGEARGYSCVENKQAQEGQAASIRLGLAQSQPTEAYIFFACDQPYFQAQSLAKIRALVAEKKAIVYPAFGDRPGNPVAFPSHYRPALLALRGDQGGRHIIRREPSYSVQVGRARELWDIDRPQDLERGEDHAATNHC